MAVPDLDHAGLARRAAGLGDQGVRKAGIGLSVLASGQATDAGSGARSVNADAAVLAGPVRAGKRPISQTLAPGRVAYLVPVDRTVTVNGIEAQARDGVATADERGVTVTARDAAAVVLVDAAA